MSFEEMWASLAPIGRRRGGGYVRQAWGSADEEARGWFLEECSRRGLRVETDAFGNTVGWWDVAGTDAVLTGSHLDSVVDGGGYDGPLGVVSGLAAVDALRDRGLTPARSLGVAVFREEEGSRFPMACLGSRLATGAVTWEEARGLRDTDGLALADVLDGSGGSTLLDRVSTFVELHVEQGRDLVHREAAVGLATGIWPHGRYRFEFSGRADHAGTTRMEDRLDPMPTCAATVLAARERARSSGGRATFGRLRVEPNGTNAIPSRVTGWLDARAGSADELRALVAEVENMAVDRAGQDGTDVVVTPESVTNEVRFDEALAARLAERGWPRIPTAAGHDAGVLSQAGIRTAMLFVRNPTGVSHAPEEHADPQDCLAGVDALADVLATLVGAA